ncbi:MAG: LuxR C-terminal-related transcriptional regulator [Thermomicrobiales bacterium]|nr:LuxR C-terminal-related transcriptional regulator [Thermomicrobiales bacterium]
MKLTAPTLGRRMTDRPRLTDLLDTSDASVILVAAPAGYGKSMFVRQWLELSDQPWAWIAIDRFDNEVSMFFNLLLDALRTIDERIGAATRELLDGPSIPASSFLARSLASELQEYNRPFTLILDDYHLIGNPEIHRALAVLLKQVTSPMRFVIVSRIRPPLPFTRIQSRGGFVEVGQDDLSFRNDEAFDLLHHYVGLDVDRADADSINERVEGWAAGLCLVAHTLRGQARGQIHDNAARFLKGSRSIETYLWEEVIDLQPPTARAFLLDISILDQFCAPLCDAVSGGENAARIIHQLEQDQLFIVGLDEQRNWFRFHQLFADALLRRLTVESSQAGIFERHQRAARWFEDHELIEDASRHAIAGEDWDHAARLMERLSTDRFPVDSLAALCSLFEHVPNEVFERVPGLAYRYAWALIRLGRYARADQMISILEDAWPNDQGSESAGQLLLLKAYLNFFIRPTDCSTLAAQAVRHLPADQRAAHSTASLLLGYGYVFSGQLPAAEQAFDRTRLHLDGTQRNWVQLSERVMSGLVLIKRGRLEDAAELLEDALRTADDQVEYGNQLALNYIGRIRIEQMQLDAAAECLARAQELRERCPSPLSNPLNAISLAELNWARGDAPLALRDIERAIRFAGQLPVPFFRGPALALQARMWIWLGQDMFAQRWARSSGIDPALPFDPNRQYEYLTYIRWLIANRDFATARTILEVVTTYAIEQEQTGELVEIYLLRAIVAHGEGASEVAIEELVRSLSLGHGGGFMTVFVNELPNIDALLSHDAVQLQYAGYIHRIQRSLAHPPAQPQTLANHRAVGLTRREADVLALVATGLSNREIGDRLYIGDKTVKRHLNAIYRKLNAANRVQAIDHARREHLLD